MIAKKLLIGLIISLSYYIVTLLYSVICQVYVMHSYSIADITLHVFNIAISLIILAFVRVYIKFYTIEGDEGYPLHEDEQYERHSLKTNILLDIIVIVVNLFNLFSIIDHVMNILIVLMLGMNAVCIILSASMIIAISFSFIDGVYNNSYIYFNYSKVPSSPPEDIEKRVLGPINT